MMIKAIRATGMCGMHPEDLGIGKLIRMVSRFAVLTVSERP